MGGRLKIGVLVFRAFVQGDFDVAAGVGLADEDESFFGQFEQGDEVDDEVGRASFGTQEPGEAAGGGGEAAQDVGHLGAYG